MTDSDSGSSPKDNKNEIKCGSGSSSDGSPIHESLDIEEIVRTVQFKTEKYWQMKRDANLQNVIVRVGGGAAASVAAKRFLYYWEKGNELPWNWRHIIDLYRPGDFNTHLNLDR
ncbi:uncharacterized protein LOC143896519 [Temnothorax americanus]|uniref:uncharacterized protein LOC143896519 n=1 Tax=Temnothorax americanus TaxID=1964332 RepID=UPI00406826B8